MKSRAGSILVGLLWVLALLAVTVTSVLYTARMDMMVAKNYSDSLQAQYLAIAGAEKAIASTRTAAMSNVRGIAADAAGQIVQQLTGVVPDAASVNAAVDASLKG